MACLYKSDGGLNRWYLNGGYLNGGYLNRWYLNGGYLNGGYLNGGYLNGGYLYIIIILYHNRMIGMSRVMPAMDTFSSIMSTSVSRDNGFTNMSFIRLLDTLDTEDISLTQDRFFIFAWGGPFDYQTGNVGKHVQTPMVSPSRIVIPNLCIGKLINYGYINCYNN